MTETTIDKLGRVVIPVEQRRELGLKPGDKLRVVIEGGEIRLMTTRSVIRQIQKELKRYRPKNGVLRSDELSNERADDAAGE